MSMESMIEDRERIASEGLTGSTMAIAWIVGAIGLSAFLGMAHTQYEQERRSLSAMSEIEFLRKTKRELGRPEDPIKRFIRVESLNEARKGSRGDEIPAGDRAELNRILLALDGGE